MYDGGKMSPEPPTLAEPRRRDRARTEAALIGAALAEFSHSGFKAATTRAIAARVGCSEALIQNYFGGKDGLLMAVMRSGGEEQMGAAGDAFFGRPRAASASEEAAELLAFIVSGMRRLAPRLRILFDRVLLDPTFGRRFAEMTPRRMLVTRTAERLRLLWPGTEEPDVTAEAVVSLGFELGFIYPELLQRTPEEVDAYVGHYARLLAPALRLSLD